MRIPSMAWPSVNNHVYRAVQSRNVHIAELYANLDRLTFAATVVATSPTIRAPAHMMENLQVYQTWTREI